MGGARVVIPRYEWAPAQPPLATIVTVHGLGDHGRALPYVRLADALVSAGFRVVSYDQAEHGTRKGRAGERARMHGLVAELGSVARAARGDGPQTPLVAVGLSMGAMVAIRAANEEPDLFDGLIAASAPLGPVGAGRAAILAATILGRVIPGMPLNPGIDMTGITNNAADRAAYLSDPLCRTTTRMGLASDLLATAKELGALVGSVRIPALFLHGQRDSIAPWPHEVAAALQARGHAVEIFPQGYHNLFLDMERHAVFEAITRWLTSLRLEGHRPATSPQTPFTSPRTSLQPRSSAPQ
jgi:alpha-beta hydrolase superfamily lysophospholipase